MPQCTHTAQARTQTGDRVILVSHTWHPPQTLAQSDDRLAQTQRCTAHQSNVRVTHASVVPMSFWKSILVHCSASKVDGSCCFPSVRTSPYLPYGTTHRVTVLQRYSSCLLRVIFNPMQGKRTYLPCRAPVFFVSAVRCFSHCKQHCTTAVTCAGKCRRLTISASTQHAHSLVCCTAHLHMCARCQQRSGYRAGRSM
jgi:hypothetical protein